MAALACLVRLRCRFRMACKTLNDYVRTDKAERSDSHYMINNIMIISWPCNLGQICLWWRLNEIRCPSGAQAHAMHYFRWHWALLMTATLSGLDVRKALSVQNNARQSSLRLYYLKLDFLNTRETASLVTTMADLDYNPDCNPVCFWDLLAPSLDYTRFCHVFMLSLYVYASWASHWRPDVACP